MNHFDYRNGVLHAEAVNLSELADAVGTPFYCYSSATLERHYRVFSEAFAGEKTLVCYAMKANSNQSVLRTLAKLGAGADVVSGGELKRALAAGFPAGKILFSGVGKTEDELRAALAADILCINVESEPSSNCCRALLWRWARPRASPCASIPMSMPAPMRKSPPASPRTSSASRSRMRAPSMPARQSCRVLWSPASTCISAARSPISAAWRPRIRILSDFVHVLRADGHTISHIDFGGGLGIPYYMDREAPPAPAAYAAMVKRVTHNLGCTLMFEPGRMIVGNAGILVTRVIYVKRGDGKNFIVIDAAMNDLIRPTLYEAHHDILPVRQAAADAATMTADVVGPVCETGDYLALDRKLPMMKDGDLIAILTAGAYGAVQSGTYNTRPLVPEVLVKDDKYAVVRPRVDVDALIAMDRTAPWL